MQAGAGCNSPVCQRNLSGERTKKEQQLTRSERLGLEPGLAGGQKGSSPERQSPAGGPVRAPLSRAGESGTGHPFPSPPSPRDPRAGAGAPRSVWPYGCAPQERPAPCRARSTPGPKPRGHNFSQRGSRGGKALRPGPQATGPGPGQGNPLKNNNLGSQPRAPRSCPLP